MREELISAIADLKEDEALTLVKQKLEMGETPLEIVEQCRLGVEIVGKRYREEKYFLSDLIMSEEILRGVMEIITPYFTQKYGDQEEINIIMGTIEGDIHDLGKNIIIYLLKSVGINVYDLGVDVKPEEFVAALKETNASLLGISVVLTFCINGVKKVVDLLDKSGLRDDVKIIIGGYPVNQKVKEYTGVDYFENDPNKAVDLIKDIVANEE
ncbi:MULTISPECIES: cobalamin B12-binding domain-containing protein [unclassified Candidatus Frackibacter]|uniref:cobalamin B12-binding domain-containing protein n=1 Tax=unclassified Candidatus Frackibacter TaxID=2648818 RepID=UPI0007920165|nr:MULTISPECIES: cobalamin-dependent protein [unclassified Candidatus Frackibacter]KXS40963.1 MAG: dimethylamine corrinoid protein 3 [Candidatus Frackibacter sp. T328-2]SDC27004.1 methylmalonyl-CoA mutase C-terminal domain-containing protein [Candidatus Frackibacter sp. WG11]SEM54007.1 methylmalonyl-CoA mutase C-terminal domain-containing protein [Candidatus Frackibacter sp. WG12]SFL54424.1 methylmalonyl-CoA mutase C-terminal domain-containing protein [Candidatus Frackibacter sp. WG13]